MFLQFQKKRKALPGSDPVNYRISEDQTDDSVVKRRRCTAFEKQLDENKATELDREIETKKQEKPTPRALEMVNLWDCFQKQEVVRAHTIETVISNVGIALRQIPKGVSEALLPPAHMTLKRADSTRVKMAGTDETVVSQDLHVGMLLRCFLCQNPLPEPREETYPDWQGPLVSVFPFTTEDGSIREQLRSTHLRKLKLHYPNKTRFWSKNFLRERLSVQPCGRQGLCGDYCPECRPDRMVYLSHRDCWKVAFSSAPFSSPLDWSCLAVQTRPFETRDSGIDGQPVVCHEDPPTPLPASVASDSSLFHASTTLAKLLSKVRALPPELQLQIMSFLKNTMFASLLQAMTFVSEFALGRFGLRGVRISYQDGSFSSWLGDSSSCWLGTVLCSELSKLNVIADQLRIVCVETGPSAVSHNKISVMWYRSPPPSGISTRIITPQCPDEVLHYYPGWKQCQYLPLTFGSEYASGLTVYIGSEFSRIIGIVSHGSSDVVFGEAVYAEDEYDEAHHGPGIPIHFAFRQGECLTSAWVHMRSASYPLSAGLLADTSPAPDIDEAAKPPLLPIHAEGPTLPTLDFANHLRNQKTRYGFSTASLNDIATMHVRKKTIEAHSKRVYGCAGLHIVHRDSSVEILGRWDPRDKACISKLYDASEGSLTRVTFHMGQAERATHVENITVGVTDNPWDCQPLDASLVVPMEPNDCGRDSATRTFDCTQDSQRVAWWFTFGYDDITRDRGSPAIQIEEETDLVFAEALEVIQVD
ncbi:hypothetical protein J7T55_007795 [Diaporthe amygdali]|uniref:uncharacterized protein n=1 Tax=Phomopsis amygdali TaxID=1214568 RepID=UPI0022FE0B2B|nr:uncharacterized protein J7T55_007795 [Diaporthe amygdali]KAJ0107604.1 hypothetical protein J7T55_007795 [Diaporthe amygdali]